MLRRIAKILQEKYPDLLINHSTYYHPLGGVYVYHANTNWMMTIYNDKMMVVSEHFCGNRLYYIHMRVEDPKHLSTVDEAISNAHTI